jgi:NHL repeat
VLELPAGWPAPSELPFSSLNQPNAVAVDTTGDVYVTDGGKAKLPRGT